MKLNKTELITILQKVKPGIANKDIIEQSTSFIFLNGKVMTYNDEIAISHPLDVDFTGAIEADIFYKYLGKLKEEEIEIKKTETEILIKGKKAKAGFKIDPEITLPIEEFAPDKKPKWNALPDGFIDAVKLCTFSASSDMSRPILTCIHACGRYVESTDNHRVTRIDLGKEAKKILSKAMLIPARAASELVKFEVIKYNQTESWVHFKTKGDVVFSCRTYIDNYPDTAEMMEVEGEIVTLSPKIKDVIDRASVFAKQDFMIDEEVEIKLSENEMLVKATSGSGWFKESVRIKREKDEKITFRINPNFLMEAIDRMRNCVIGESLIKFEGENFEHVIELMK